MHNIEYVLSHIYLQHAFFMSQFLWHIWRHFNMFASRCEEGKGREGKGRGRAAKKVKINLIFDGGLDLCFFDGDGSLFYPPFFYL